MIRVENLTKIFKTFERSEGVLGSFKDLFYRKYKDFTAVDSISLNVEKGELLGYIGPNGAGKSTSIKMLTGILKPTSGKVEVMGFRPFEDRKAYTKNIGVVFGQRTQLWWDIAVRESFNLIGKIYQVPPTVYKQRLELLCGILGIEEVLSTPVRKLSLGQRMRCDIGASLIHNPQLLFLDEPTIGLDAVAKDSIRNFLKKINEEFKTTIILTTHDLKEIEALCQRIVVLDHGKIIFDGPLSKIKAMPGLKRQMLIDFAHEVELGQVKSLLNGSSVVEKPSESRVIVHFDPTQTPTAELVRLLLSKFSVADLTVTEPSIDEVIMKIYQEGFSA